MTIERPSYPCTFDTIEPVESDTIEPEETVGSEIGDTGALGMPVGLAVVSLVVGISVEPMVGISLGPGVGTPVPEFVHQRAHVHDGKECCRCGESVTSISLRVQAASSWFNS